MKKNIFTLLILSTSTCFADQLDGIEIVVKFFTGLLVLSLIIIGLTIKNGFDISKGRRKSKAINIRAILAIIPSIFTFFNMKDVNGATLGFASLIIVINSICIAINNKAQV